MIIRKILWLVIFIFHNHWLVAAQSDSSEVKELQRLEHQLDATGEGEAGSTAEQRMLYYEQMRHHPLNLNTAALYELIQVPGMNFQLARSILNYRKSKPFEMKSELLNVPGIGKKTYAEMLPYVRVSKGRERFRDWYLRREYWFNPVHFEYLGRYQRKLKPSRGYQIADSSGGYRGGPGRFLHRFQWRSTHISMSLVQEKDPGESLQGFPGFDLNSFHLSVYDMGRLNRLVIGDYRISVGQGLIFSAGNASRKGMETTRFIANNEKGIKPNTSSQESGYLRGAALSYGSSIKITAFYSNRAHSASPLSDSSYRYPSSTGLHRTLNEWGHRNALKQKILGGRILASGSRGMVGVTGYESQFSRPIGKGQSPGDLYDYTGQNHSVIGVDYRWGWDQLQVYGEWGRSVNDAYGSINGVEFQIPALLEVSVSKRNYQKDFQSLMGSAFAEGSGRPQNEEGWYAGVKYRIAKGLWLYGYADRYHFPFARSGSRQSSHGRDHLVRIQAQSPQKLKAYVLLRQEINEEEFLRKNERGVPQFTLGERKQTKWRVHIEYNVSPDLRVRSRIQWNRYRSAEGERTYGWLLFKDVRFRIKKRLRVDARITFFDTQSYDSRVYQYESDLLYVFSSMMLNGRGERRYVNLKYELHKSIDLWFKYGITIYEDRRSVGSGLNEVPGNRINEIGFQIRLQF